MVRLMHKYRDRHHLACRLPTEVDVDNRAGQLLPGADAEVHFKFPEAARSPIVRVDLVHVVLGKDYGDEVEVVSGIEATDSVIVNPPDSLRSGEVVRVVSQETGR